jgi:hypothetical protein
VDCVWEKFKIEATGEVVHGFEPALDARDTCVLCGARGSSFSPHSRPEPRARAATPIKLPAPCTHVAKSEVAAAMGAKVADISATPQITRNDGHPIDTCLYSDQSSELQVSIGSVATVTAIYRAPGSVRESLGELGSSGYEIYDTTSTPATITVAFTKGPTTARSTSTSRSPSRTLFHSLATTTSISEATTPTLTREDARDVVDGGCHQPRHARQRSFRYELTPYEPV